MPPTPSQRRESGAPALAVSGEEVQHASLLRALRAALGCGRPMSFRRAQPWREATLLRRKTVVRRASCDLQHQASLASHAAHARLRSPFLGRRRSTQACCCARAVLRWLWCARALSKGAVPARAPFPSARVRDATCQLRRPTPSQRRLSRGTGAPALAVSGEKAPHSSLLRARAVPRCWLWSAHVICEESRAGPRPLCFGARAWCDVRAAAPNAKLASHASRGGVGAPALAVSGEVAQHETFLRALALSRWLWSNHAPWTGAAPVETCLLRRTTVMRRASCSL